MSSRSRRAVFFARGLSVPPSPMRGRGECRAPDAPDSRVCNVVVERTRVSRSHRNHPAFPTQWFYGFLRALPGDRALFATVIPEKLASQELDSSVGEPGPHDFAVRLRCPRQEHPPRPPQPVPRFVTIAYRPSQGTGCRNYGGDLLQAARRKLRKSEYFFEGRVDRVICRSAARGGERQGAQIRWDFVRSRSAERP